MVKIRVHELAKELDIPSREMVKILQDMGLDIKNHMSTLEDSQAVWVRKRLQKEPNAPQDNKPLPSKGLEKRESSGPQLRPTPNKAQQPGSLASRETVPTKKTGATGQTGNNGQKRTGNGKPAIRHNQNNSSNHPPEVRETSQDHGAGLGSAKPGRQPRTGKDNSSNHGPHTHQKSFVPAGRKENTPPVAPTGKKDAKPAGLAGNKNKKPFSSVTTPKDNKFSGSSTRESRRKGEFNDSHKAVAAVGSKRNQPHKDYSRPVRKAKHKKKKEETETKLPEIISVEDFTTVRNLAEKLNRPAAEIVKKLMDLGTLASINQRIDFDTAEIVASLYEVQVQHVIPEEKKLLEEVVDDEASLVARPPIVTIMGHVDHGKTSLLDRIRKANVVSGEAGGITQHIGAYQATINHNKITFIDTPGHEAFTAMRARGANLTDIVVLVVAADDGVMPQTIEAINHIKAAEVPFLVALNKIDKPGANPEKVMQQLTEYNIVAEQWGGDTIFVPVSAKTGEGIDQLLEMILLVAEMHDLKANPDRAAEGVVIEGRLDKGRGAVATVLVQKGTLNIGDNLVCGVNSCKVRAMTDYLGNRVDQAGASMPVEITGWSDVPEAGSKVVACDEKVVKEIISLRLNERKIEEQGQSSRVSLDEFFKQMQYAEVKELRLIIKGDVQGSVEAIVQSLLKLGTEEVKVNVIHSGVGAITETDVMLASASNAIIIGFNVRPDNKARKYAEEEKIDVRLYRVIYEMIDDVKKAMAGLLEPEYKERFLGRAEVRATFKVPNIGTVGGCYVTEGKILRNASIRVLRDGVIVYEGKLASLKRFKDDAKEVTENFECGMNIENFNDIKIGDMIEAYIMDEVPRQL